MGRLMLPRALLPGKKRYGDIKVSLYNSFHYFREMFRIRILPGVLLTVEIYPYGDGVGGLGFEGK